LRERGVQEEKLVGSQKAVGLDYGHDGLVESCESAIPIALFVAIRERQRLQAAHAGHFLDAVDQQRRTGASQHENECGRRGRQAEVHGGVHHVNGIFAATHEVLHLAQARIRHIFGGSGKAIDTANFLHGG